MLLDKEISVGLNGRAKYYEELGYEIPRRMTKQGKLQTPLHARINVKVEDLPKNSMIKIRVKCDCCGKELIMSYQSYNKYKHGKEYYCNNCSKRLFYSGRNSYMWNENKTDEERINGRDYLEYTEFVKKVLARDNYTCQCCGKILNNNGIVHHLDGYNWCVERRTDETNGITLCELCHGNFHMKYGKGNNTKEQFEEWIGHAIGELEKYNGKLPIARKIYCVEEDRIYDSSKQLAKEWNIKGVSNIHKSCNYYINTVKGKHLLWLDEYENMTETEITAYYNKIYNKIICLNDNNIFNSIKETSEYYKCSENMIRLCCNKKVNSLTSQNKQKLQFMYLCDYNNGERLKEIPLTDIICLYDNKIFTSPSEAGRYYNCNRGTITKVCKGEFNYVTIEDKHTGEKIKSQFMFLKDYNEGKKLKEIDYNRDKYKHKIICINHNKKFDSIKEASEFYKCCTSSIGNCCRDKVNYVNIINPKTNKKERVQFMYLEDFNKGKEINKINSYKCICEYDGKIFDNPKEASIYYKCHINSIRNNCDGRTKSVQITTENGEKIKTKFKYIKK